jgi:polyphosphate kinase
MCINKEHKFEKGYALMLIASNLDEIYNITTSLIKHSKDAIDKITTIEEKLRKDNLSYIDELIKEKLAFGFVALSTIAIKEYDYSIGKLSKD